MHLHGTFDDLLHFNCDNKPLSDTNTIDLVTIGFNNELVISHQIRLLQKNLLDPYCYTVADNSPEPVKREKIMQICKESGAGYIGLPPNPYNDPNHGIVSSMSHGLALNWVYENYIICRKTNFFGFLDHDVYPIRPTKIIELVQNKKLYGLPQSKDHEIGLIWYLHPGFCFFEYDFIKDKKLDFKPVWADTGSGNWYPLYKEFDLNSIQCPHGYNNLKFRENSEETVFVEFLGDWMHTFNGSNWRNMPNYEEQVNELLNKY